MAEFDDAFTELRGRAPTVEEQREAINLGSIYKRYPALDPLAILVILTGRIQNKSGSPPNTPRRQGSSGVKQPRWTPLSVRSRSMHADVPTRVAVLRRGSPSASRSR